MILKVLIMKLKKGKKYDIFGPFRKSNIQIVAKGKTDNPITQIHDP